MLSVHLSERVLWRAKLQESDLRLGSCHSPCRNSFPSQVEVTVSSCAYWMRLLTSRLELRGKSMQSWTRQLRSRPDVVVLGSVRSDPAVWHVDSGTNFATTSPPISSQSRMSQTGYERLEAVVLHPATCIYCSIHISETELHTPSLFDMWTAQERRQSTQNCLA
jgi:hypothetical protein